MTRTGDGYGPVDGRNAPMVDPMGRMSMWFVIYNGLMTITFLLLLPLTPVLFCLNSRYRVGLAQRFGIYPKNTLPPFPGDRPLWIHAASVGEVRSAEALVNALKQRLPEKKIIVSTFTAEGNRIAKQLPGADAVVFLPLDLFWIVRHAFTRFDPALLMIIETEIWPNFLRQAYRRGIPVILLSGRLSVKAVARYKLCQKFFRSVLGYFSALGMQSAEDAARVIELGADSDKVSIVGSLKFARPNHRRTAVHRTPGLKNEFLLVAGSTHCGEEECLIEGLALARAKFPNLSLVVAPRHPERFDDVAKLLQNSPFTFQRRSQAQPSNWFDKDILLLDSVGELVDFFAVADLAFVGGSLVQVGGHNILEPARCGRPILFGPHMINYQQLAAEMLQQGAAVEVMDAWGLAAAVNDLLSDPAKRTRMGQRAAKIAATDRQAIGLNLRLAERFL